MSEQPMLPVEYLAPWIDHEADANELWGGPCCKCGMVKSCTGDPNCECDEGVR